MQSSSSTSFSTSSSIFKSFSELELLEKNEKEIRAKYTGGTKGEKYENILKGKIKEKDGDREKERKEDGTEGKHFPGLEEDVKVEDSSIGKSSSRTRGSIMSLFGWKRDPPVGSGSIANTGGSSEIADSGDMSGTVSPTTLPHVLPDVAYVTPSPLPVFPALPSLGHANFTSIAHSTSTSTSTSSAIIDDGSNGTVQSLRLSLPLPSTIPSSQRMNTDSLDTPSSLPLFTSSSVSNTSPSSLVSTSLPLSVPLSSLSSSTLPFISDNNYATLTERTSVYGNDVGVSSLKGMKYEGSKINEDIESKNQKDEGQEEASHEEGSDEDEDDGEDDGEEEGEEEEEERENVSASLQAPTSISTSYSHSMGGDCNPSLETEVERISIPQIIPTLFACLSSVLSLDLVQSTVRSIEKSVILEKNEEMKNYEKNIEISHDRSHGRIFSKTPEKKTIRCDIAELNAVAICSPKGWLKNISDSIVENREISLKKLSKYSAQSKYNSSSSLRNESARGTYGNTADNDRTVDVESDVEVEVENYSESDGDNIYDSASCDEVEVEVEGADSDIEGISQEARERGGERGRDGKSERGRGRNEEKQKERRRERRERKRQIFLKRKSEQAEIQLAKYAEPFLSLAHTLILRDMRSPPSVSSVWRAILCLQPIHPCASEVRSLLLSDCLEVQGEAPLLLHYVYCCVVLCCVVLYCIVLYCIVLCCVAFAISSTYIN